MKITKKQLKQLIKEEIETVEEASDRYWISQQQAKAKYMRSYNRPGSLQKAIQKAGKYGLKKLPFIGGLLTGAGLLLMAQEAFAADGAEGVIRVLTSPENKEAMIDGVASLTGIGSAAVVYKDILNAANLKLSKADIYGGPAPAHTRKAGQPGRNCWTDKPVVGFPHCDELKESKLTKNSLKQLIKEEYMNEMGMDPQTLINMLCTSETLGAALVQRMAEEVLKDPTNIMVVLGPYKEQIEQAAGMDLKSVVNMGLDMSVEVPFLGPMKVRQALDMAAANPMVKNALMGMIPQALSAVCGAADQAEKGGGGITIPGLPFQESKKLTKNTLKQLIKEEYRKV